MTKRVLCFVDIVSGTIDTLPCDNVVKVEKPFGPDHPYPFVVTITDGAPPYRKIQAKDAVWIVTGSHAIGESSFEPAQVVEACE